MAISAKFFELLDSRAFKIMKCLEMKSIYTLEIC